MVINHAHFECIQVIECEWVWLDYLLQGDDCIADIQLLLAISSGRPNCILMHFV